MGTAPTLADGQRDDIVHFLLAHSTNGVLKHGQIGSAVAEFGFHRNTIANVWKRYQTTQREVNHGGSYGNCVNLKSGRKPFDRGVLMKLIAAIPMRFRRKIRTLAFHLGVSSGLVHRLLKEEVLRRHSNKIRPLLTEENEQQRLQFAMAHVDPSTCKFSPMYDVVHVDEKWFYEDEDTRTYYLLDNEEPPLRQRKSKRFIEKTMFVAAVARPRYDAHRKQFYYGKLGIWPFTEKVVAKRSSVNRPKGTIETKNMESITRSVYKQRLLQDIIPAIKAKWPVADKKKPIFVQQDNCKVHVPLNDPDVLAAGQENGWCCREFYEEAQQIVW